MFQDIKSRLQETLGQDEAIKESAERSVVAWRYSLGQLWDYQPEWQGVKRLYITTEETSNADEAKYAYGYDAQGRVVCTRHYGVIFTYKHYPNRGPEKIPHRELQVEYFIGYYGDFMEVLRFAASHRYSQTEAVKRSLQFIDWLWFKNGKVVEFEHLGAKETYTHTLFAWDGELLRVRTYMDWRGRLTTEDVLDDQGGFVTYGIRKDGSRFRPEESPLRNLEYGQLFELVRQRLVQTVPRTVQDAKIEEPIYCVALAYDSDCGEPILPPILGIGLESERQNWLRTKGEKAANYIWCPGSFHHCFKPHTEFDDDELHEASFWLNSQLEKRDSLLPAIRLIVEAAKELEKMDWSEFLLTTPDFLVYATDFGLNDLTNNVTKIISPEKLARLKAAKLL